MKPRGVSNGVCTYVSNCTRHIIELDYFVSCQSFKDIIRFMCSLTAYINVESLDILSMQTKINLRSHLL